MSVKPGNGFSSVGLKFEMNIGESFACPGLLVLGQIQFVDGSKWLDQFFQIHFCSGFAEIADTDCAVVIVATRHIWPVCPFCSTISQTGRYILGTTWFARVSTTRP